MSEARAASRDAGAGSGPRLAPRRLRTFLESADPTGLHYAVEILVGSALLWLLLSVLAQQNPIWAMGSMVAVTEPQLGTARAHFRARLANTFLGGTMGFLFLLVAGPHDWVLPLATATTVLVSFYVLRVPKYWRIGPVTAALVMVASLTEHSRRSGTEAGLRRLLEVFLGGLMAVGVSLVFSKIWPTREGTNAAAGPPPGPAGRSS